MSTMAGFDVIVEVSTETALRLIQANVNFGGVALSPPFSLEVPVGLGTDSYAAVIVTGMSLDLVGDQGINLVLNFQNTSIISKSPALTITLLDGTVTIGATLQLVDFRGQKALATDLSAATAQIFFSDPAKSRIAAGLSNLPIDTGQLISFATTAMESFVRATGQHIIPNPTFTVEPGKIGSISQGRFERLTLHNIAGRSIGLFGMLLPDKPLGNASQKSVSLIPPGQDLCVEIGQDAFQRLIFCPNLAGIGGSVASLPPPCGSGTLDKDGVTFTSFADSFGNGQIDINANFTKSGTCYDATGSVHAAITLSLSKVAGKSLVAAHVAVDDPFINVDVPWYCTLAEVLIGPIGLLIADSIQSSAKSAAGDLQGAVSSLTSGGIVSGTGSLSGATFNQVTINTEAIVLAGTVAVDLPVAQSPSLTIMGSVTTSDRKLISNGVYVVSDGCMEGSYPYFEDAQSQSGTFLATATLLGRPLNLEWHLECWEGFWGYNSSPKLVSAAILKGTSGTVVLDGVSTSFPFPLPGGSSIIQPVHVAYSTTSNTITLSNLSGEGNYGFILTVKATDPAGNVATAQNGVGFEGDTVIILGGYQEKLAQCIRELLDRLKRIRTDQLVVIPPWVPVNYPDPGELAGLIRFLAAQSTGEADEFLLQAKLAHGSSYLRALSSREAVEGTPQAAVPELGNR
jgi:hypothetical protein